MSDASGKVILFIGGARSGKSAFAEKVAATHERVSYIATAEAIDDEMQKRINKHREERPRWWVTYEANGDLLEVLTNACHDYDAVIVDCLTVYAARRMERIADDGEIIKEIIDATRQAKRSGKTVIFVSNEVGLGLVPEHPVGRRYRDLLGSVNRAVADIADHVLFTIAGIPIDIKALSFNRQDWV